MFGKYLEMPAMKWLKLIENEKLRTLVIERTLEYPENPKLLCSNVHEALFHSFDWEKTKEGEYYWLDVYNSEITLKESEIQGMNARAKMKDLFIAAGIVVTLGVLSFVVS